MLKIQTSLSKYNDGLLLAEEKYNYTQIKQYFDGFNKFFFIILT